MLPAHDAVALFEDDATEPAGKGRCIPELAQVEICLDKGFLGRILGQVKIAEEGVSIASSHVLEAPHQNAVRFQVADLRTVDQCRQFFHVSFSIFRRPSTLKPRFDPKRFMAILIDRQITL